MSLRGNDIARREVWRDVVRKGLPSHKNHRNGWSCSVLDIFSIGRRRFRGRTDQLWPCRRHDQFGSSVHLRLERQGLRTVVTAQVLPLAIILEVAIGVQQDWEQSAPTLSNICWAAPTATLNVAESRDQPDAVIDQSVAHGGGKRGATHANNIH